MCTVWLDCPGTQGGGGGAPRHAAAAVLPPLLLCSATAVGWLAGWLVLAGQHSVRGAGGNPAGGGRQPQDEQGASMTSWRHA